jgi:single-strand DNA-binding protein
MAGSLNRAQIIGNLTRDPEVRKTAGGQSVTSFSVATNRVFTDAAGEKKEQVEYHNLVAWGKLAEICGQYLAKGRKVYVDGRLQTREWDAPDGAKKNRTEIVVENMVLLDRAGGGGAPGAQPTYTPVNKDVIEPAGTPDDEIKLEDIPF